MDTLHQANHAWLPASPYRRADGPELEPYDEAFDPQDPAFADVLLLADSAALIAAQRNGIPPALESGTACRRETTPSR